jgi:hypothetical protein
MKQRCRSSSEYETNTGCGMLTVETEAFQGDVAYTSWNLFSVLKHILKVLKFLL